MTCAAEDQTGSHGSGESSGLTTDTVSSCSIEYAGRSIPISYLIGYLFLVFPWEIDEMIVFRTHQEGNGGLIEPSSLSVPFFDRVQGALPRQVEHEQNSYCIVADQR